MKARLFVLGGRDVGRSFDVTDEIVFGRGSECGARLGDRSISRRHARVACAGGVWFVEDLDSRNGVRVGGERVARRELADHDEFTLGDVPVRFRDGAALDTAPPVRPAADEMAPGATGATAATAGAFDAEIELEEDAEIELEEEIHLDEDDGPGEDAAAPAVSPVTKAPAAPEPVIHARELERARILADDGSRGLLRGDLGQRPGWVRALVYLLVLLVGAGMFLLAFGLVRSMRETL